MWTLDGGEDYGRPRRSLRGHSHYVQDVTISSDGQFALSGSWDGSLRLWDLNTGTTTRRFAGADQHKKDVLSVAFSADNRQIVSGARDKTIKLWNTLGECKYTIQEDGHTEWVSCVRFSPSPANPLIVSCGWDKLVKVWNLTNCKLRTNLVGHTGYLNTVTVSPDGSLCASGGKDGTAMLWDLNEGKHLYSLEPNSIIHAMVFSPNRYWLCAAHRLVHQDLGPRVEVDRRRADPRLPPGRQEGDGPPLHLPLLVGRRRHPLLGLHRRQHPRLVGRRQPPRGRRRAMLTRGSRAPIRTCLRYAPALPVRYRTMRHQSV